MERKNDTIYKNAWNILLQLNHIEWKTWSDLRAAGISLCKSAASHAMRLLHESKEIQSQWNTTLRCMQYKRVQR